MIDARNDLHSGINQKIYHETFTFHSRLSDKNQNFDRNKNECFLLLFIGGAATSLKRLKKDGKIIIGLF